MKLKEEALRILLREADEAPEEEEKEEGEEESYDEVLPDRSDEPEKPVSDIPLEDHIDDPEEKEAEVIAEGQIPQDSSGVEEGEFGPMDPHGEVDVQFEEGNWGSIADIGQVIEDKVILVTKTLEPLIEKSLIELLGSSSMYKRQSAEIVPATDEEGNVSFTGSFKYQCGFWIGADIEREDIEHDSQYILNTLAPLKDQVTITSCAIDVSDGTCTVSFTA
jgi:hypothetical protein